MQNKQKLQPLLVRLYPETRAMLDRACEEQRRSRAAIINEAVKEFLAGQDVGLAPRLDQFLGARHERHM